jgi:hypothetical protein
MICPFTRGRRIYLGGRGLEASVLGYSPLFELEPRFHFLSQGPLSFMRQLYTIAFDLGFVFMVRSGCQRYSMSETKMRP